MTLARYFVFHQGDAWIVAFEGRVMAHFPTKTAALDSARGMANLMGAMHYDADVMLDDGGPLQPVWIYGQDELVSPAKRRRALHRMPTPDVLPRDHSLTVWASPA